jgi:hypothetical protein
MVIELNLVDGVPSSEFSKEFAQGMVDRMAASFFKYGRVAEGFPNRIRALQLDGERDEGCLEMKLRKYRETGNTEWLMDAANYCLIEFMHPRHPNAHFRPTDSKDSNGRKWVGEVDPNALHNDIRKHV